MISLRSDGDFRRREDLFQTFRERAPVSSFSGNSAVGDDLLGGLYTEFVLKGPVCHVDIVMDVLSICESVGVGLCMCTI